MKTEPFFSVVTITRNNLGGLLRTCASLRAQHCEDYEWIVIDGASSDGTPDFLHRTDGVHFVSEPDDGLYEAMNKGLDAARGRYVIFMNAGDSFAASDTLGKIIFHATGHHADFLYGDALEETPEGLAYKKARPHSRMGRGMITHHQAMIYRREAVGSLRYDTRYTIAADYDFTVRFTMNGRACLYCPFALCVFESGGVSQQKSLLGRNEQFTIRRRVLGWPAWKAAGLWLYQAAAWHGRRALPGLYVRFRGA